MAMTTTSRGYALRTIPMTSTNGRRAAATLGAGILMLVLFGCSAENQPLPNITQSDLYGVQRLPFGILPNKVTNNPYNIP